MQPSLLIAFLSVEDLFPVLLTKQKKYCSLCNFVHIKSDSSDFKQRIGQLDQYTEAELTELRQGQSSYPALRKLSQYP